MSAKYDEAFQRMIAVRALAGHMQGKIDLRRGSSKRPGRFHGIAISREQAHIQLARKLA